MQDALNGALWWPLLVRVDKYIMKLEQRAGAAAMCYISSHRDDPTWKDVAQRLHAASEKKAAMAAKAYLTIGIVSMS